MSHFQKQWLVLKTDLCIGAMVAISCINYVSDLGLYNGAWGKIIDIVYNEGRNCNSKQDYHLPHDVIVDCTAMIMKKGLYKPWDSKNPTVSSFYFILIYESATISLSRYLFSFTQMVENLFLYLNFYADPILAGDTLWGDTEKTS